MQITATAADFEVEPHVPDFISVGGVRVCAVCGRLSTGVYWGRAPRQPRLDPDAEEQYRREQES